MSKSLICMCVSAGAGVSEQTPVNDFSNELILRLSVIIIRPSAAEELDWIVTVK